MPRHHLPPPRIRLYRNGLRVAVGVALAVHALILALVVLPGPTEPPERSRLIVVPEPIFVELPAETRPSPVEAVSPEVARAGAARPAGPADAGIPSVPIPTPAVGPPQAETIPRTGLTRLQEPILPLVATPYGIGRRPVVRDQALLARMRAESLVSAMVASAVEVKPPMRAGPLAFPEGGGVSIPIPWGGFVRDDREDGVWREERCRDEDDKESDKPGEGKARRSQCG